MNRPVEPILAADPFYEYGGSISGSSLQIPPVRTELGSLSDFRVRLVRNEEQLQQAIEIRVSAYSRHLPALARKLANPEQADRHPDTIILLAESRRTGIAEGTVRIQTNLREPCEFEKYLDLPPKFHQTTIAHISRLGVRKGRGSTQVKVALFKSLYRFCLASQIRWLLVGSRPPVDRTYEALGFEDVFAPNVSMPIPSVGDVFNRVMAFEVPTAERRWREINHPYYQYMFVEYTPDVEIFNSISGMWATPRQSNRRLAAPATLEGMSLPIV